MQCSRLRFMARHSSGKLVKTVFFVPSRATYADMAQPSALLQAPCPSAWTRA